MLRKALLVEVEDILNKYTNNRADDFVVEQTRDGNMDLLTVRFQFEPKFTFEARFIGKIAADHYDISASECPGEFSESEHTSYPRKNQLLTAIGHWAQRIQTELRAIPIYREVEAHAKEIEALLQRFENVSDEYFSHEEAEKLRDKLDELEEKMRQNLEQSAGEKKDIERRIAAIHADIEALKQSADALKKRGWVRSLVVRATNWAKDPENQRLVKSGAELAKILLPDGSNNQLNP